MPIDPIAYSSIRPSVTIHTAAPPPDPPATPAAPANSSPETDDRVPDRKEGGTLPSHEFADSGRPEAGKLRERPPQLPRRPKVGFGYGCLVGQVPVRGNALQENLETSALQHQHLLAARPGTSTESSVTATRSSAV